MKRFLFVFLTVFALFGLVACGDVGNPKESNSTTDTSESVEQNSSSIESNSGDDLDLPMDEFE